MSLPIAWVLKNKPVLLVGGGEVAETRIRKLMPCEAAVVVVAPELTPYIQKLADDREIVWVNRTFVAEDIDMKPWTFVLTAINSPTVSRDVAKLCRAKRIPVNVADVIPLCDFYFGANFEQGPLKVMVSTGSGAPRLARRVLDELAAHAAKFQFGDAIRNVQAMREILREQLPGNEPKVSRTRMALMRTLCDKLSFSELASLKSSDFAPMIRGMLLSTAACPARPIELPQAPKPSESESESGSGSSKSESESSDGGSAEGSGSASSSSDSGSDSGDSGDSGDSRHPDDSAKSKTTPAKPRMKRHAIECVEGYPQPKVPAFPFPQRRRRTMSGTAGSSAGSPNGSGNVSHND